MRSSVLGAAAVARLIMLPPPDLAFFVFLLGEFYDQDGVLGGKADQHNKPNLSVDIEYDSTDQQCRKSAKHGNGCAEKDAERQGRTFIEGSKYEEYKKQ